MEHLNIVAKKERERVLVLLDEQGLPIDEAVLSAYCTAYARYVEAEMEIKRIGTSIIMDKSGKIQPHPYLSISERASVQMLAYARELGLTPSSRLRLDSVGDTGDLEALIRGVLQGDSLTGELSGIVAI